MKEDDRRKAYLADVTYVTNCELGFDYLRDNLVVTKDSLVLRDFYYCIVDEVGYQTIIAKIQKQKANCKPKFLSLSHKLYIFHYIIIYLYFAPEFP